MAEATAFWITGPGQSLLRREPLPAPGPDEVLVETLFSGVSRGTERLVYQGLVPASQHQVMRAPFQAGAFTYPIKYGYSSVGVVTAGEEALRGRTVFCLHPHQDRYVVPADAVVPVPDGVPAARAVLGANLETALNGWWDAPPRLCDRIAVVGAGVVGAAAAALAAGVPGSRVELIDINPRKAAVAEALGVTFRLPDQASGDADLVLHASGSGGGLAVALGLAGFEATVLELSWYGQGAVAAPLGEAFHSRRLVLRSSQVGAIAPARRARRSHRERLAQALALLADPRFDALLAPPLPFAELPAAMPALMARQTDVMCQLVTYR
jgi:threonine dehydrogenase-like Zn-dependent dehydrogenase